MFRKVFKILLLIIGILLLILMSLLAFDLVYTIINPHIVFAGNSMMREILIVFLTAAIGFLIVNIVLPDDKKRLCFQKSVLYSLFSVYIIVLITTLFGRAVYTRIGKVTNLNGLKGRLSTSNFIPFRTISLYIYAYYKETINASTIFENLVGNLLMFMPMGVFLPLIYKSTRIKHCVIMLLTLILVEVIQLITDRGIMDIDDIILNYLGFFMVYCIVQSKLFMKIKEKLHILL